jgi:hypothetical protein
MDAQRVLRVVLRVIGTASVLAIVAVFMPRVWMAMCHEWLGLGPLPDGPVVEYLARSTSMFYALFGGVLWILSGDVCRHARVIMGVGGAIFGCGAVLLTIDLRAGLPGWWVAMEGPFVMLMGLVYLGLAVKVRAKAGSALG